MRGRITIKRRSHLDIIKDVLELCLEPRMKTAIMYMANLSYRQLEEQLAICLERGLLKKQIEGSRVVYITTEKGSEFLEAFDKVISLIERPRTVKLNPQTVKIDES